MYGRALCFAAALAAPAAGLGQPVAPISPTGPWIVAFEEGVCLLQREYGTAQRPLTLSMRQVPTVSRVAVHLVDSSTDMTVPDKVRIGFGGGAPATATLTTFRTGDQAARYNLAEISRGEFARGVRGGQLSFDAGSTLRYSLAVPGLDTALAKVDECIADQLVRWGVSPAAQAATLRFPRPKDDDVLGPEDFIINSPDIKQSGMNLAFVRVDERGTARDCKVPVSSGTPALDQASCDVLLGARFTPAQSRSGEAIASVYAHAFRWRAAQGTLRVQQQ